MAGSRPIEAALCKRTFQLFTALVAVYCATHRLPAAVATWVAPTRYKPFPDRVCFRPLGLRDRTLAPSAAQFASFGLTLDGSPLHAGRCLAPEEGAAACVEFASPVAANGYYFETAGDSKADPIMWTVEAKSGNETVANWRTIGASTWLIHFTGVQYFFPSLPFPTPMERGARVTVSVIPPWMWGASAGPRG